MSIFVDAFLKELESRGSNPHQFSVETRFNYGNLTNILNLNRPVPKSLAILAANVFGQPEEKWEQMRLESRSADIDKMVDKILEHLKHNPARRQKVIEQLQALEKGPSLPPEK
jgi:hypothetical protein